MEEKQKIQICEQCEQRPVIDGGEYCYDCIIEDAKTMGVIE